MQSLSSALFHVFSQRSRQIIRLLSPSFCHPPPHLLLLLLFHFTSFPAVKSIFNLRLDYNSEVTALAPSTPQLSERPPPNQEERLFINVLLTKPFTV